MNLTDRDANGTESAPARRSSLHSIAPADQVGAVRPGLRGVIVFALSAAAACIVTVLFITVPGINGNPFAMFHDMVHGQASRPFVYRALLPTAIRFLAGLFPPDLSARIVAAASGSARWQVALKILRWEPGDLLEYLIAAALVALLFLLTAFVLRRLVESFFAGQPMVADIVPAIGIFLLPTFFVYYNYIYDPCTLLLTSTALLLAVRRRTIVYYVCFAFACTNKETAILLVGSFALAYWNRMGRRALSAAVAAQIVIWACVKAAITWVFRDNPGAFVEFHVLDHTAVLLQRPYYIVRFVLTGGLWALIVSVKWREKPRLLRYGLGVMLFPLLLLAVFIGYLEELRMYYEAFPLLFLLAVDTFLRIHAAPERLTAGRPPEGPDPPSARGPGT